MKMSVRTAWPGATCSYPVWRQRPDLRAELTCLRSAQEALLGPGVLKGVLAVLQIVLSLGLWSLPAPPSPICGQSPQALLKPAASTSIRNHRYSVYLITLNYCWDSS